MVNLSDVLLGIILGATGATTIIHVLKKKGITSFHNTTTQLRESLRRE